MKSSDFLSEVWGEQCKEGEYVFLSVKSASSGFRDYPFIYGEGLGPKLDSFIEKHDRPGNHVYFCPLPFKGPRRAKELVARSSFLWSDLDDKANIKNFNPTHLWESSPGRFQALWRLDGAYAPTESARLSKQVAYALGADKGGWDLTQVLRVPGTHNHKYESAPIVRLIHRRNNSYTPADVPDVETGKSEVGAEILQKYKKEIPRALLKTIFDKHVKVGARSDMLWSIENQLVECGLTDDEVIAVVRDSTWNKYKGRRDEDERLRSELRKIRESTDTVTPRVSGSTEPKGLIQTLKYQSYGDLMAGMGSAPGWMFKDFWMRRSHGIVAGEPKSYKSTLVLDMAFAMASATPFLGMVEPGETGSVIYVNNENAGWILKDRFEKLSAARGETGSVKRIGHRFQVNFPRDLPLYFVNQQGFSFDDPLHLRSLEALARDVKPRLIIFDPLYLMLSGDVNSAKDLSEHLTWLLQLKQEFNCGIILIHHWNKNGSSSRGGQRMLGSTTLHGWIESAWYLESMQPTNDKEPIHIIMEREFRGASVPQKLDIRLHMGEIGNPQYAITFEQVKSIPIREDIINILETASNPISKRQLKMKLGVSQRTINTALLEMENEGTLEKVDDKYKLANASKETK